MHQMTRTLAFVIAASASVIGAVVAHIVTKPPAAADAAHEGIGQPFYPDFVDPTKATAIRVAAWNPKSSRVEQFEVSNDKGQWRIPSHYNYPADATDQLAKAAASAVGIVRGSLVSEAADSFERLGVVDPLDQNVSQGSGSSGTRITLYEGDDVVADFIVGRKPGAADDADENADASLEEDDGSGKQSKAGMFFVRRPDEKRVYLAQVNIDVSTRFRDWINKDLLDLSQFDLRKIVVNRYSVDEDKGTLVRGDISELSRDSSSDPWKLDGLDDSKERVKTGVVSAMARALDQLQIVGIRRKPDPLVKFFTDGVVDIVQLLQVQSDLQRYGFFFDQRQQALWANEGEILAGAKDGVTYVLRFGEVFTGSDLDVEVGQSSADSAKPEEKVESAAGDEVQDAAASDAAASDDREASEKAGKRSRYVIVEAVFDPSLLGPEPTPPVKPSAPDEAKPDSTQPEATQPDDKPASEKPAAEATPATDAKPPEGEPATDSNSESSKPAEQDSAADKDSSPVEESNCDDTGDANPDAPTADAPTTDAPAADAAPPAATDDQSAPPTQPDSATRPRTPQDDYAEALEQYKQDLAAYQAKKKDYDKRVADGKKRVEDLNKRFAEWYYVISADLFEDLSVNRDQLVEPAEPEATDAIPGAASPDPTATPAPTPPSTNANDADKTPPADDATSPESEKKESEQTPDSADPSSESQPEAESTAKPDAAPESADSPDQQ
ncbi:MAG: DUF4340 domain-containing protein [Planctomycetaceae bacterium]|nr:DUF4340 domain-containing protein [Planctomycetaceae bacterium]